MVISALCRCFSTARMTLTSKLSPRIFPIFVRPVSISLRIAGVISYCLPVYSTFIERASWLLDQPSTLVQALLFHSALVGARDTHVLPIFGYRATSDLYTLRLENAGDLLVGQRPGGIFFLDELLHPALQDEQRSAAALGTVDALAEEVAEFENSLGSVGVLVGHGAAHS